MTCCAAVGFVKQKLGTQTCILYCCYLQGNLKLASTDQPAEVVPSGPCLSLKLLCRLEHIQACLACQFTEKPPDNTEALSSVSPLRSIPISTGLPAPWTGIKAFI